MGFLSNILSKFTGVFSDKKEEVVTPCPDCNCDEPKADCAKEKVPVLVCDVPSTPLQVVEIKEDPKVEAPVVVEQPKVEAVVERMVEVSAKEIKAKATKKPANKKPIAKKVESKTPSKKKGK